MIAPILSSLLFSSLICMLLFGGCLGVWTHCIQWSLAVRQWRYRVLTLHPDLPSSLSVCPSFRHHKTDLASSSLLFFWFYPLQYSPAVLFLLSPLLSQPFRVRTLTRLELWTRHGTGDGEAGQAWQFIQIILCSSPMIFVVLAISSLSLSPCSPVSCTVSCLY